MGVMATWGGVAGEDASGPRPGIGLGHPGGGQWPQGPQSKADGRRPAVLTGGVLLPSAPSEVPAAVEATRAPREGGILQILGACGAEGFGGSRLVPEGRAEHIGVTCDLTEAPSLTRYRLLSLSGVPVRATGTGRGVGPVAGGPLAPLAWPMHLLLLPRR